MKYRKRPFLKPTLDAFKKRYPEFYETVTRFTGSRVMAGGERIDV